MMRKRRGAVLIVVMGVLMVLSLLAVTFAQVVTLDRSVSRGYLDEVRARLIARSGTEHAVHEIATSMESGSGVDPAMQYWGANTTEAGAADWATPLEQAKNPSYAHEDEPSQNPRDANVTPLLLTIDGQQIGFSRTMDSGTYAPHGDLFRLRVADANSMIHVNDGIENGTNGNVSRNLKRILNTLGNIVGAAAAGDRILAARPPDGYRAKDQLEAVLGSADYRKIKPFVTTVAWIDPSAVNPVPLSTATLSAYPVRYNEQIGLYRYGRSRGADGRQIAAPLKWAPEFAAPTGTDHAVMALDELNAQWIERVRRAPVNVNQAPHPVLTALIAGLRGWFLVERRKSNPDQGMYTFLLHTKYDNTPTGKRGDEIGYLYSTQEFLGGGTTSGTGVPAAHVADEIIACRDRRPSPYMSGVSYAGVWYGGPFRTWRQFNAFCDGLVTGGLLAESRPIFFDFQPTAAGTGWRNGGSGPDTLTPSQIQRQFAAQAMADVLKANFNPNCTLNELNPDANLYTIVDKTDLIVNSTEFCLSPMGIVEIESEGLVVRSPDGADLLVGRRGEVVARKKVLCVVKVFDAYRETAQADFMRGEIDARPANSPVTSSNRPLEIGPEPDNGPAPQECRWSGWIQLATVGGHWGGTQERHRAGAIGVTPAGQPELDSTMHAHFSLDHRLHHHGGGHRDPIASTPLCRNNADRTETQAGPYGPASAPAGRHRLARDWRLSAVPSGAAYQAASDLRIDGAYVERDSALMFASSLAVFDSVGTLAMWVKPSYFPEMSGKPRTWFCVDTVKQTSNRRWQIVNGLWFFASADAAAFQSSPNEGRAPVYDPGPWRPSSVVCGFSTWDKMGGGVGTETDSLNHRAHTDRTRPDLVRHHGWMHVAYCWDLNRKRSLLWINGEQQSNTQDIRVHPSSIAADDFVVPGNPIRLGEPSLTMQIVRSRSRVTSRNWAADATLDEFYLWRGNQLARGQDLFAQGRYYRPLANAPGVFTSRDLPVGAAGARQLAPSSTVPPPTPTGSSAPAVAVPPPGVVAMSAPRRRILATAWTWYAESVSSTGAPQLHDYLTDEELRPEVEMRLVINGTEQAAALTDDGGSPVSNVVVGSSDTLKYRLRVRLPAARPDVILLATPVIDDVTIYFTDGVEYLSYHLVEVSL